MVPTTRAGPPPTPHHDSDTTPHRVTRRATQTPAAPEPDPVAARWHARRTSTRRLRQRDPPCQMPPPPSVSPRARRSAARRGRPSSSALRPAGDDDKCESDATLANRRAAAASRQGLFSVRINTGGDTPWRGAAACHRSRSRGFGPALSACGPLSHVCVAHDAQLREPMRHTIVGVPDVRGGGGGGVPSSSRFSTRSIALDAPSRDPFVARRMCTPVGSESPSSSAACASRSPVLNMCSTASEVCGVPSASCTAAAAPHACRAARHAAGAPRPRQTPRRTPRAQRLHARS